MNKNNQNPHGNQDIKLLDWTRIFLNYKKAMGFVSEIKEDKIKNYDVFIVVEKGVRKNIVVIEALSDKTLGFLEQNITKEGDGITIMTLNTRKNLDFLIKHWDSFLNKKVTLYFVNPRRNEKWFVNTKIHSFITEDNNLKKSLKALFESVEPIN
ncbi:hypothetical protein B6U93_02835 [Candidatus Woesearchaeota archaeon ex4484_78]|nr:MAG: hypothetical protein B6U93_02835 [Candidatus Woesearchaeota archaeon ex4484_78]